MPTSEAAVRSCRRIYPVDLFKVPLKIAHSRKGVGVTVERTESVHRKGQ
jgi:hypothetical protein